VRLNDTFDPAVWAHENGAVSARVVDGQLVAILPMTYGKYRLTIGDESFIEHGY
jgi:hypothetical protein